MYEHLLHINILVAYILFCENMAKRYTLSRFTSNVNQMEKSFEGWIGVLKIFLYLKYGKDV